MPNAVHERTDANGAPLSEWVACPNTFSFGYSKELSYAETI
jgi:hypothetical protein